VSCFVFHRIDFWGAAFTRWLKSVSPVPPAVSRVHASDGIHKEARPETSPPPQKTSDCEGGSSAAGGDGCSEGFSAMTELECLGLLNWAARQTAMGRRGRTPEHVPPLSKRWGLETSGWCELGQRFVQVILHGRRPVRPGRRNAKSAHAPPILPPPPCPRPDDARLACCSQSLCSATPRSSSEPLDTSGRFLTFSARPAQPSPGSHVGLWL